MTESKVIITHLADNNDPFNKTACGIDMPYKNRASGPNERAWLCTDCVKVAMGRK